MASSGLGKHPLRSARRLRGKVQRPGLAHDGAVLAAALADYVFGPAPQPAPAPLATTRIPDADGGFRWIQQWRTDVLTAWDGTEQRISTRSLPRDRYEGSFLLDDADLRYVRQLLSASPAGQVDLPLPHEAVATTAAITGGTIYVTATHADWIAIGRRIYVRAPSGAAYTTTITGANGGTLNVADSPPVGATFPAGLTLVFPVEGVLLDDGQGLNRYAVAAGRWPFAGRSPTFRAAGGAGATVQTFSGLPVLDRRPHLERTAAEQILGGVQLLDAGGAIGAVTSWGRSKHRRQGLWRIDTPAERQWWKAFLGAVRGRWKPFLYPTWWPDLELWDWAHGESWLQVLGDYLGEWWPSLAHRRLQLEYADGSVVWRSVVSAAQVNDTVQQLEFSAPLPATGTLVTASFLETCRLDVDEVAIEYGAGWRGRVQVPALAVQDDTTPRWPSSAAEMRTAAGGLGTWASGWQMDEASGSLADAWGGVALAPGSSPLYGQAGPLSPADKAVGFDSTFDRFEAASAATYDLNASQSLAVYLSFRLTVTPVSSYYLIGKVQGAAAYWVISVNAAGNVYLLIYDLVGSATATVVANHADGQWHDAIAIIDRESQRIQVVSDMGASAESNISARGSLSTSKTMHVGGTSVYSTTPHLNAFTAIATGDVYNLRLNAAVAIANLRRYTGRA